MDIATWPFSIDPEYSGKGFGFMTQTVTIARKADWGYEFNEDPEQNERGYKRTWSGPQGPWDETLNNGKGGRKDYTGPVFNTGDTVRVRLTQREGKDREGNTRTYHNLVHITAAPSDSHASAAQAPAPPTTPANASPGGSGLSVDERIARQVGFKGAVELLSAHMMAGKTAYDPFGEDEWKTLAQDTWLSYNLLMRGQPPDKFFEEIPAEPAGEPEPETGEDPGPTLDEHIAVEDGNSQREQSEQQEDLNW